VDSIQQRLTEYAVSLSYGQLPAQVVLAAKVRIIDTLGALIAGLFGEPCRIARQIGAQMPDPAGATMLGTRMKTTPDLAAFVNATTARYPELTDSYHTGANGHPSDVLTSVLAAAEHVHANGRDYITSVVLAYEIFLRFSDAFHGTGFDYGNFSCV